MGETKIKPFDFNSHFFHSRDIWFIIRKKGQKERFMNQFKKGWIAGMPICIGYCSVAFAFGMMVTNYDLPAWIAAFISMTNLTSAGQFAGLNLIVQSAPMFEIFVTTLIINLRYLLMGLSLSQKLDAKVSRLQRCLCAWGLTDEIFAVAMNQKESLSFSYFMGLTCSPYIGWTLGTILGATLTSLLPKSVASAMNIALYGMFIAILMPQVKEEQKKRLAIGLAILASFLFTYFSSLSSGWIVILVTIVVSGFMAVVFPIEGDV